ncbi:MAG: hypothetical protein OEM38_06150, partial [Gammaproteobacteria bacterium]|nr:hypothetical protein [Gammaproteobacteria bacterium]
MAKTLQVNATKWRYKSTNLNSYTYVMANISIFLFIFTGVLVIAGWISSEMISTKATRANKKLTVRAAKLENENNLLTNNMSADSEKFRTLKIEFEKAKEARDLLNDFESEYRKVQREYNKFSSSIDSLR